MIFKKDKKYLIFYYMKEKDTKGYINTIFLFDGKFSLFCFFSPDRVEVGFVCV